MLNNFHTNVWEITSSFMASSNSIMSFRPSKTSHQTFGGLPSQKILNALLWLDKSHKNWKWVSKLLLNFYEKNKCKYYYCINTKLRFQICNGSVSSFPNSSYLQWRRRNFSGGERPRYLKRIRHPAEVRVRQPPGGT